MKYSGAELRFRLKPLAALSATGLDVPSGMELPDQNEIVVSLDPPTRSRAVLDRVKEMRAAGKLWKEICKEVGLTYRTLSLRMKQAKDAASKAATPVEPAEAVSAAKGNPLTSYEGTPDHLRLIAGVWHSWIIFGTLVPEVARLSWNPIGNQSSLL